MSSESYSIKYSPEAANVPHWLIFANNLGYPCRLLAVAILAHQQSGAAPTREMLAGDFDVNTRTIDRWLDELRAAELLSTHRHTRQHLFGVLEPRKPRESIHVSTVDKRINVGSSINVDKLINVDPCVDSRKTHTKALDAARVDPCVDSRAVGVVGDHDFEKREPTATNRAPLKTQLGRWLKQAGLNAARQFDDPALDYWTYRRFVETKRAAGWEWRQIVSTLREAPLDIDPHAAPADDLAEISATPAPAGKTIEDAQARWEARRGAK